MTKNLTTISPLYKPPSKPYPLPMNAANPPRKRRLLRYYVWTDEDGPMKPHRFASGANQPQRIQATAQWWSDMLECYVQLHDKKGRILSSAGKMFDAPTNACTLPKPTKTNPI